MPGRIRPTHRLSATTTGEIPCTDDAGCPRGTTCGENDAGESVCVGGYGTPVSGETDVIGGSAGEPAAVRFHIDGVDFTRGPTGERTTETPAIEARGDVALLVSEGDTLALESIASQHDDYSALEAQAVKEVYGRRARPSKVVIELAGV